MVLPIFPMTRKTLLRKNSNAIVEKEKPGNLPRLFLLNGRWPIGYSNTYIFKFGKQGFSHSAFSFVLDFSILLYLFVGVLALFPVY